MHINQQGDYFSINFHAMASQCEILIETTSLETARKLGNIANDEAKRIENKFSRYRRDNIIYTINHSSEHSVTVDAETARLLDFAQQCFNLSNGLFDITSGVLGRVWHFDGSDRIPLVADVNAVLPFVCWNKVSWNNPSFTLPQGMQIDFGGIGKEYAVDRVLNLLQATCDIPFLVNFGGDLHANKPPMKNRAWSVGVEAMRKTGHAIKTLDLYQGALTTSGDATRFLQKGGVRYGHILNPKTGWPVVDSPASITVAGNSCTETGILSTLAILHGDEAEQFLKNHDVTFWCQR